MSGMRKPRSRPDWKRYERLIARMLADESATDLCVTPNARIRGQLSGVSRQIDVLIDSRHDTDNSRRVVVDAKKHRRKIHVKHVEELEGLMRDVGATRGYLVAPSGATKAAVRRAQEAISIAIVPIEHVEHIDPAGWPQCEARGCDDGRVFWDGFPELWMDLIPITAGETKVVRHSSLHLVGKCDCCGRFHVKCLTCADMLSFDDEQDDVRCSCKPPWFWLTSIEHDEDGESSAELHVVLIPSGEVRTVDRRPYAGRMRRRRSRHA